MPEFTSVKSLCIYFNEKSETIRSKFSDKVQNILLVQRNRNQIQNELFFLLNVRQKMKLKSLFGAHRHYCRQGYLLQVTVLSLNI